LLAHLAAHSGNFERQHHVFEHRLAAVQKELLEYKPKFFAAQLVELSRAKRGIVFIFKCDRARIGAVERC
jgi:hypothetical protein